MLAVTLAATLGCTTKNYVRQQTTPLINKTNELDDLTAKNSRDIKDVDQRAQRPRPEIIRNDMAHKRHHDDCPFLFAASIMRESRSSSSGERFSASISISDATACAIEPSQKVCNRRFRAERRARSRRTVGR